MIGKKDVFGFRQLLNQYIIVKDDIRNNNVVGAVFPHESMDNAILTYCFIHPQRGIAFEVLAMAKITQTGMEETDLKIDIREANPTTSFLIEYNSINGDLVEFKPDRKCNVLRSFDNKVDISKRLDQDAPQEIRDMREIAEIDKFRHEIFPDDLIVTFVGKLPKPEAIWCKGVLSDDGKMMGKLLNEPWDSSIGLHEGDLVNLEIRTVDGQENLFAVLENEDEDTQKRLNDELKKLKEILKENPEFCKDSLRFNELVAKCNLSERLKDNLLLCIEDDVVLKILSLDSYTDDIVSELANQLTNDCNMEPEQAVEAVLWWMNILELDEIGRKERRKRLQIASNSIPLDGNIRDVEAEIIEVPVKKVSLPNVDFLADLDLQLKELIAENENPDETNDVKFTEVPDIISSIQSQLDELIGELPDKNAEKMVPVKKEKRRFMTLQHIIEEADFQFPIDVQASDWDSDRHMQIETIRGDWVYGSIYDGKKYIDMERLALNSNMQFAFYEK